MQEIITHTVTIPEEFSGKRLDQALALLLPQYSRTCIKNWIDQGKVSSHEVIKKPKDKVKTGEEVHIHAALEVVTEDIPENIALEIIYEDSEIIVVNKPVGMVVHPAAGNRTGTMLNALLHHCPSLQQLPRAGIVHRLDKDTSGLLIVAKTLESHHALVKQLQKRTIKREYLTIVHGVLTGGGTIDAPIGRDSKHRTKMAIVESGKPAITHYLIMERFHATTLIQVALETGRTHQIRVHMAHRHHAIIGDPIYSGRIRIPPHASEQLITTLRNFKRQALHARRLCITHPKTQQIMCWEADVPADMQNLLDILRAEEKDMECSNT